MYPGQGTVDLAATSCAWTTDKIQLIHSAPGNTEQKGKRPLLSETEFSTLLYQDFCDAKY